MPKARRAACRNWRSRPRAVARPSRRRTRGRRRRDGRSPAGGRGSGGCGRCRGAGAAACRGRARARSSKCVRASRGSAPSTAMRVRTRGSRPIGASIVPVRAGGRPSTSARYSRSMRRVGERACRRRWASSVRATTSRPEVSRSRRWTMPARSGSAAGRGGAEQLGERALAVAARGVHDEAGRLVDRRAGARPRRRS